MGRSHCSCFAQPPLRKLRYGRACNLPELAEPISRALLRLSGESFQAGESLSRTQAGVRELVTEALHLETAPLNR